MRVVETLSASTGGIGRHVADLAPRLAALGHDVTVLCPPSTAAAHDLAGLDVGPPRRLARLRGVDVVHAHGYKAAAAALPWTRLRRIPLVVSWHNAVLADGAAGRVGRALQVLVARGADLTLGASTDLVAAARAAGARHAALGPVAAPRLAAPTVPRERSRAALGLAPGTVLVVTVGRLAPQKNLGLVLDVAARLAARTDLTFVLAGGGPLQATLAARAAREGTRVRLLGPVDDVASLLAAADLMLLTSSWEARALVAQEALLAGLPLVSTRVGGIEELVGDAAVLVPGGDAAAAAAAVVALADDPARRAALAAAGLRRAATWPDEDEVAQDLSATYGRLVDRRAGGHSTKGRPPT
ncbi:Glycosyltransferase involved in cell wall bisynthesis [Friedmanniella luteola]|uniref:Glycosyltransferase involved in cell wall bisynthesis n=1 Tax=Friedmanniella luteola TaxID=546871 RepID=A0A1H1QVI2_9ACTN|nr:glycosyltransferase family 4 protein [Friedmanniella luteola]SDS27365.1 Glycosyltransferase involved in cell wall bisynthesis [Friedmanniella luteola]